MFLLIDVKDQYAGIAIVPLQEPALDEDPCDEQLTE